MGNTMSRLLETATFAGGCFWCLEAALNQVTGCKAFSGYMGGTTENPTYRSICSGATGHAEVVQVHFDSTLISFTDLLRMFWFLHDPTTLNQQGNDVGTQYRSAIFYHSDEQRVLSLQSINALQPYLEKPIVTEVSPATTFYLAEPEHQGYFPANPAVPYCSFLIAPKIAKFQHEFKEFLVN